MGVLQTSDPLLLEKGDPNGEIYRDLKRDGQVFECLQKRQLALISRPWQVEPVEDGEAGTADAEVVTDILKRCAFDQVCRDLMDALLRGFAVSEIVWTVRDGMIVPDRVVKRAQRRFKFVQQDENAPPELRLLTRENMLTGIPLKENKFIVHRVNPEDDNPYGTGLGLQLYWPVFFKRKGIIAWNKLNDRFGSPTPWGRYPRNAGPKEKGTLFDALRAISNDGVVMTPEGMQIELLESKLTGTVSTQKSLCDYMDDWIAGVLLGQEPRASGGGALAAASKERTAVRLDLVQADSDLLSDTLNNTLIRWICEYNGLAPCLVYRVISEEEDLKASSETDKNVAEMGFELNLDAVRAKYGEGWEKKAPRPVPPPVVAPPAGPAKTPVPVVDNKNAGASPPEGGTADFAERTQFDGQQAIDDAIAAIPDAELQAAMAGLMEPLLAAIDAADSFEEALAAAEAAYPQMNTVKLQSLLARAMFGAEAFGRQEAL
ncbi:MAG: DUF935 family protein [Proteobacteria bacterium]|nr:DUF935 family protein [Pseudomonadota bacterium]